MSYRLHLLLLPALTATANLCFEEDFCIVAGQTADGGLVLPTCENPLYLVPGGVLGLPYLPELGRLGARYDFHFPVSVVAIVVATYADQAPVPQAAYTAPVAVDPKVTTCDPLSKYLTAEQTPGAPGWSYGVELTFSDNTVHQYFRNGAAEDFDVQRSVIGKTAEQLVANGWTFDV
jgi:hypothetical protein